MSDLIKETLFELGIGLRGVIWKFPLKMGFFKIQMPEGAVILSLQEQYDKPVMWALCNPDAAMEIRTFEGYTTGYTLPKVEQTYLGTIVLDSGGFVLHYFELFAHPSE